MGEVNRTKSLKNSNGSYTEFYYHFFRNILLVSIPLAIISAVILSSLHISATGSGSGTDSLTISISSACTLGSVVDIEHNTNTNVGTYTPNIGKTTITTLCNDGNGYSVYAVGYSNNEEGNNKLINTDPNYSNHSIETGLNTSGLTSAWAMKLNNIPDDPSPTPPTIESDYNNTYGLVPSYWTKVAGRVSGTTDMAEGSSFTTTYAVYASSSQYAGTYQGQVKYLLTHPSYEKPPYYMQDIAYWKDELILEESVQAIDKRDGKSYWVTKLKDGNIWMTQNLDFDITGEELNSNTTDLNTIEGLEYENGYSISDNIIYWKPANTAITIDFQNTSPVTGWQNSSTEPYSANKTDAIETGHASFGNYYNWTTAIASNNSSTITSGLARNSICPKGWRLPIISNYSNNDFINLNQLYTDVTLDPLFFKKSGYVLTQLNSIYSLGLYLSANYYPGADGIFGASITNKNFITNTIWVNDYGGKKGGDSIRCIAR
ncbi:hypothetical protein IJJ53_01060 [Candidatus Saccharibacteria bacterium]|nr:hypothetical protein [Candidatus Saccharibacteria bacterium]